MRDDVTKKYSNGEITVVWKPSLCTHSSKCWKGLGSVFNPTVRPWITMEGGSTEQIRKQVDQCPSGALTYVDNDRAIEERAQMAGVTVEVSENGPLNVSGEIIVKLPDGTEKVCGPNTSLCRCGQSGNKPFCDGSHETNGFKG
jgi:uncharacterized Fe-S cluster protein YjdI